ncbi:MAG: acyl-CoA dehydrogenase family protein [candidate division KSB1 bacterium]|nr:acyl-CoA dehydrogenase family protein [candidate division KSB1 bacterium]
MQTIAECNAALAMALHVTALGAVAARQLGRPAKSAVLLPPGSAGFAGTALAKRLASHPLSESERLRLRATFPWAGPCERPLLFHAPLDWESVVFAGLRDDDRLHWRILPRESIGVQRVSHAHGLNELPLWRIDHLPEANDGEAVSSAETETFFLKIFSAAALGTVAIALGTTRRAAAIVRDYAAGRRQGGRAIREHAAVQLLLGRMTAAIESVAAMLAAAAPATGIRELQASLACKAIAHPLLCEAANAAMQVMGGYGYMQDMGIEKIVRDTNHLRLLGGTPRDLQLFLAESGGMA